MKVKKPLRDLILIKPDEITEKKIGGIIIPDSHSDKFNTGVVISKGKGVKDIDIDEVSIGDKILYEKNSGIEVKSDDGSEKYLLVRYSSIFAILEND